MNSQPQPMITGSYIKKTVYDNMYENRFSGHSPLKI